MLQNKITNVLFSYNVYTDKVEHKYYADFVFGSVVGFGFLSGLNPFSHALKLEISHVLKSHFIAIWNHSALNIL